MKARGLTKETILSVGMSDKKFPAFRVGDTIVVNLIVKDGDKERTQAFEGDVLDFHNNGIATTFTIRRIGANGIGVEKILPLYSPTISDIRVVRFGRVRRANLHYVRERLGKSARIQERVQTKSEKAAAETAAE